MIVFLASCSLLCFVLVVYDLLDLLGLLRVPKPTPLTISNADTHTTVDVIIPVYNAGQLLIAAVDSVLASTYARCSLIVVDDGSTDAETLRCLDEVAQRGQQLLRIPHQGKFAAVNAGVGAGKGDVIVVLDADSAVGPDFIERLLLHLQDQASPCDAVDVIPTVANRNASFWTRMAAFERRILSARPTSFGALFAIRRSQFVELGFRDCLSPQFDIDLRLRQRNQLRISNDPPVDSLEPTSMRAVYRRKRRWVYGMLESLRMNGLSPSWAIVVPLLDLLVLALFPFACWLPVLAVFPVLLLLVWWVKSLILAHRFGLPLWDALGYPLHMLVVCVAVVDALFRNLFRSRVPWK